ncbi:MAG: SAM-dependent chlorinase/fluorinase [Deltaproteobacteria bacterium]|nr:SAM-dependent chlorinase/fluorinase [Deltaproteobacteria bacterium]
MKKRTPPPPVITLATDFGTEDGYVAAMKGVILQHAPLARIMDLGHELPAHDIRHAAFFARSAYPYFPEGTIHVMVVDPGVGSGRRGLIHPWRNGWLVGPDNGVFSLLKGFGRGAREIDLKKLGAAVSTTFHGRDVFARVAARLAAGDKPETAGPALGSPVRVELAEPVRSRNGIRVVPAAIDRFGNVILPIGPNEFPFEKGSVKVSSGGRIRTLPIVRTYSDLPDRGEGILVGSHGFWELAAQGASFASHWKIRPGGSVVLI